MAFPVLGCDSSGGRGGSAGAAGTGGTAGTDQITTGLWTGDGSDGSWAPWTICFSVNEAGDALTADPIECRAFAIQVEFEGCPNSIWWRPDIPIVDGAFHLTEPGMYDIPGDLRR